MRPCWQWELVCATVPGSGSLPTRTVLPLSPFPCLQEAERQVAAQRMQALQAQPAAAPAAPRYVPGVGWYL